MFNSTIEKVNNKHLSKVFIENDTVTEYWENDNNTVEIVVYQNSPIRMADYFFLND